MLYRRAARCGKYYTVRDERNEETDLQIGAVIRTKIFDEKYYYEGTDLGAVYQKQETTFKVWAPTARLAKVRIYKSDKEYTDREMYREKTEFGFKHYKVI